MKELLLQACVGSVDESFNNDIGELLFHIQIQFTISIERTLETVTEASMTMAGNMEHTR